MKESFSFPSPERDHSPLTYTLIEKMAQRKSEQRVLGEQQKLEERCLKREQALEDKEVVELLQDYGIDASILEHEPTGLFKLPVRTHFSTERLPKPTSDSFYAYKGGAARVLLCHALGIHPVTQPRDVDILAFGPEPAPGLDTWVAQKFMPDDVLHGGKVERFSSFEDSVTDYFTTRDLTQNEVLATDEYILMTRDCLLDTVRHIIRLTPYEYYSAEQVRPKMLAKILRFYTESIERWGEATIVEEDWSYEEAFFSPFWFALQLDKACQQSLALGEAYLAHLVSKQIIPDTIKTLPEAVDYLLEHVFQFSFRYAPTTQFELEDDWAEKQFRSYRRAQQKTFKSLDKKTHKSQ